MNFFIQLVFTINFSLCFAQFDPYWKEGRNTIVHLFEWKFEDIAIECERFLAPKGFAGVQISPVAEHIVVDKNPWWMRYQPVSYKIISRSGDQNSLASMIKRCNDVGVRIYVDIVINHMAAIQGTGIAGSSVNVPNTSYPAVPYSSLDFNEDCNINSYEDPVQVRNCRLNGLPDLNSRLEWVQDKIIDFMNNLIDLGIAGFRVDACKHMWPDNLKVIFNRLHYLNTSHGFPSNSRSFIIQEVIDLGGEGVSKYEYTQLGTITEFKFSNEIGRAFRGYNPLKWLKTFGIQWGLLPTTHALTFVDNHDNQRGHGAGGANILTYKDNKKYIMATAFHLAFPYGISRIMSSYAFSDSDEGPPSDANEKIISPQTGIDGECTNGWICEHRWLQISNLIEFKNVVGNASVDYWWDNGNNQIAFSRGNRGFIAFNLEESVALDSILKTGLTEGIYCDIASGRKNGSNCTGKSISVDKNGMARIILEASAKEFVAFHINSRL